MVPSKAMLWRLLRASALSGVAMGGGVTGFGLLLGSFAKPDEFRAIFGGFTLVGLGGIPVWILLVTAIGLPVDYWIRKRGLTGRMPYVQASVIAMFCVMAALIGGLEYRNISLQGAIIFSVLCFVFCLILGIPMGLLFHRLAYPRQDADLTNPPQTG